MNNFQRLLEASNNKMFGFYGTLKSGFGVSDREANQIWTFTAKKLRNLKGIPKDIEEIMDEKWGRYFIDMASSYVQPDEDGTYDPKKIEQAIVTLIKAKGTYLVKQANLV